MAARKVLVTGGAGYIGAHTVVELLAEGFQPVILDNFSRSDQTLLDGVKTLTGKAPVFERGDCGDLEVVTKVFEDHGPFTGVLHFAALKSVGESVREPLLYYKNNVLSMITLLEVMEKYKVQNMIFSSSCTVYGEPDHIPVSELSPIKMPESPYGATKQMCEQILMDSVVRGIRTISLRYFNPIGAHPSASIGELPIGVPSNLVPYITQTAAGKRKELVVFGGDYNTPDGSCIRDYIHVVDLARAHVKALRYLDTVSPESHFEAFNLGTGKGVSVLELINTFISVTGVKLAYRLGPRRAGDVEKTFADPRKANEVLGWETELSIEQALADAWRWEQNYKQDKRVAMDRIQMVDLRSQYIRLREEIDAAISEVLLQANFIQGPDVKNFAEQLSKYIGGSYVITCGNGTDGLLLALMALDLKPGDEIIVPAFTYAATAEVISLLRLKAVLVDVDEATFNIDVQDVERKATNKTRAVIPVHLFGQCADMQALKDFASANKIVLIEDAAQALGAVYTFPSGTSQHAGTIGQIGVTSFFPSKSLGAYGDGGAVFTQSAELAEKIRMIANHGQRSKYFHEVVGINSRLDTLQAAILSVKLKHIEDFSKQRQQVAQAYDKALESIDAVRIPLRSAGSSHVFHQYTLRVRDRDGLKAFLQKEGIPSMVYYPLPLHFQKAYESLGNGPGSFPVAEQLANTVISLPIHTEMTEDQVAYISSAVRNFYV